MLSARWWTLAVCALAAASALFWGLKIFVKPPPTPPDAQVAAGANAARGDLTRLLGADAPPPQVAAAAEPAPDARFQLIGVVSPRATQAAREGLALIAIDGKPAKAFRVGSVVDGQNVLQAVGARGVTLGPRDGAAVVALNLAPLPPAATGMLPPLNGQPGMPPGMQPQMPQQMQQQLQMQQPPQMPQQPMQGRRPMQPQNAPMAPGAADVQGQPPNQMNGMQTQ